MKDGSVVSSRTSCTVGGVELQGDGLVLGDERVVVMASKAIDIPHHTRRTMEDLKEIAKELLSPTTDLMDGPIILQDFFDGAAVAKPEELGAPKKFPVLTDTPTTAASFTNKGVIVAFPLGAATGAKPNGPETSAVHREVEGVAAFSTEKGKSSFGSIRVIRLHEDPTHAGASPVGLQKAGLGGIITSEARGRGDGKFQLIPQMDKRMRPSSNGNRLAVVLSFQGTKRLDANLKEGAVNIVERQETDKGGKGLAVNRKRPVGDQIKLGVGRTIAVRGDVVTDILNSVSEKFTLLQLKRHTILLEDITHTSKIGKESSKDSGPKEDVIDDDTTTKVRFVVGETGTIERIPFVTKDAHHAGVESRGITRTKRHHAETIFLVIGGKESKFFLIGKTDTDLVIAGLVVQADKK
jgi:hypothetical protein